MKEVSDRTYYIFFVIVALVIAVIMFIPLAGNQRDRKKEKSNSIAILNASLKKYGLVPVENVRYIVNHKTHTITMVDKKPLE